ncbi:MAG: hypothetical protein Q8N08_00335 [Methanobacteriaceae archaeon]|nr:hypothetical protein [Methanobacteriaceae archaeon]
MSRQFTNDEIENDTKIQEFLEKKKGREQSTNINFLSTMKDFCNLTGKSPTEIHDIHRKELRSRTPEFDMWLNGALDDYVAYLIDNEKKHDTIKVYVTRVKGFLHAFKLKPTPDPEISIKQVNEDFKYALTVEDIRKAINHSPPTYQVYFITQAQTGLSVSDVLLLDVEDFISAVSKKNEDLTVKEAIYRAKTDDNLIGCFDLRRKKTSIEFYTFAGPEVLRNIALLLESRDEKFLNPEMPIFIKDTSRLRKKDRNKPGDLRLVPVAVINYVNRLNVQKKVFPRITVDGKERNYFRTHKLRKWFANQVRNIAGFSMEDTKYLAGQKIGDVSERYFNPNSYTALKNNYRKAVPYLAITEEVVMEENLEAIESLKARNIELEEKIEKMNSETDDRFEYLAESINVLLDHVDTNDPELLDKLNRLKKDNPINI